MALEFGYNGDKSADSSASPNQNGDGSQTTDLGNNQIVNNANGEPADDINSISDSSDPLKNKPAGTTTTTTGFNNGDGDQGTNDKPADKPGDKPGDKPADDTAVELVVGSTIEVGDDKYTVDANGNIVDKDGSIFKEAKDVKDWMASFDSVDDGTKDTLTIDNIKEAVGIDITDDNDQPIVFENTPAGIKAYIDAVNEVSRDEIREETINTYHQRYPILDDVLNYYIANGNSLEGFGQVQDRSGIVIDDTNEAQHESIIRTAWKEQNRKGDVEQYLSFLKSSNTLLPVAKEELSGLQEADKEYRDQLAEQAEQVENDKIAKLQTYWTGVREAIQSKTIAGYQIPDTIVITKDGKKTSATPADFYNYLYQVDKNGKTAYDNELAKQNPVDRRDDELLRAYLKFVGGNYSNLVDMAVNKQKVIKLKQQVNSKPASSVKVTKPNTDTNKGANTDFGYQ